MQAHRMLAEAFTDDPDGKARHDTAQGQPPRLMRPWPVRCWPRRTGRKLGGHSARIFREAGVARLEPRKKPRGETTEAAIVVFDKALTAHGVPQRLLSNNGAALNPSRRGLLGQLVVHVMALGVEPITGKPYKPTIQGKNERFHQTLFRYLDKQPLALSS
jgi:transposase InsO family protein